MRREDEENITDRGHINENNDIYKHTNYYIGNDIIKSKRQY